MSLWGKNFFKEVAQGCEEEQALAAVFKSIELQKGKIGGMPSPPSECLKKTWFLAKMFLLGKRKLIIKSSIEWAWVGGMGREDAR